MGVLYLAKKYMVPSLADKCMEYLERNVDPTNVFNILSSAQKYEGKKLVDRCWEHTENAVKSYEFVTIVEFRIPGYPGPSKEQGTEVRLMRGKISRGKM